MPPPRSLRPAPVPTDRHDAGGNSALPGGRGPESAFRLAVAEVEAGLREIRESRPEVSFDSEPPPRRLAPQAIAIAASVEIGDDEVGAGRFVLLYDQAGQEGWVGPFRVIAYLRAELEPEIAADEFVGQVGWSWLTEALDGRLASYAAPSGSVTRVVTEGFGMKQDEPVTTEFEMRASWSPTNDDRDSFRLDRHVAAWVDALALACGLAPPGVTQLPRPRRHS
jgi:Protein of unknown function (DUF3000)